VGSEGDVWGPEGGAGPSPYAPVGAKPIHFLFPQRKKDEFQTRKHP